MGILLSFTFPVLRNLPYFRSDNKWIWSARHPPTTQTQCQKYVSCYWTHFDQTWKVGSWNPLEQIPIVTMRFVRTIFVLMTFSTQEISQLLLTGILPNFIGNIIFWTENFLDQHFLTKYFQTNDFRPKIFGDPNVLKPRIFRT